MHLRALLAAASLGLVGIASAARVDDHAALFPAMPCQDGWAACLVDGFVVDAGPSYDGLGRPIPADMRLGWFDGKPTTAFSPFVPLSAYSGKSSKPPPPPEPDPVVDRGPAPQVASTDENRGGARRGDPDAVADAGGDARGGDRRGGDRRGGDAQGGDPRGSTGSADLSTPSLQPQSFNQTSAPVDTRPLPVEEPVVAEVDPVVEPTPTPQVLAGCDDLIALEGPAMMGRLLPQQLSCIEGRITGADSQTQKDKLSRVLLMNAEAAGNQKEWERLMKRHLEDIDRSDPDLCFKYALHLSRGGVSRAWGVIKWADYALENKSQWTGTTYKTRVNSLYQLKAEAAMRLWEDTTRKLVDATGEEREKLTREEEKLRGMAKDFSMEWLDYARASGQDTQKAVALCVSASGSKKFCKE